MHVSPGSFFTASKLVILLTVLVKMKNLILKSIDLSAKKQELMNLGYSSYSLNFAPKAKSIYSIANTTASLLSGKPVDIVVTPTMEKSTASDCFVMRMHCKWLGMSEDKLALLESLTTGFNPVPGSGIFSFIEAASVKPVGEHYEIAVSVMTANTLTGEFIECQKVCDTVGAIPVIKPVYGSCIYLDASVCNPYVFCASVIECAKRSGAVQVNLSGALPQGAVFTKENTLEKYALNAFIEAACFLPDSARTYGGQLFHCYGGDATAIKTIAKSLSLSKLALFDFSTDTAYLKSGSGFKKTNLAITDNAARILQRPAYVHSLRSLIELSEASRAHSDMPNRYSAISGEYVEIKSVEDAIDFDNLIAFVGMEKEYVAMRARSSGPDSTIALISNYFNYRTSKEAGERQYTTTVILIQTGKVLTQTVTLPSHLNDQGSLTVRATGVRGETVFTRSHLSAQLAAFLGKRQDITRVSVDLEGALTQDLTLHSFETIVGFLQPSKVDKTLAYYGGDTAWKHFIQKIICSLPNGKSVEFIKDNDKVMGVRVEVTN